MFQFMTATRIIFGEGALPNSLSILNQYGYSVLLVSGKERERSRIITQYLNTQNMRYQHVAITGEPNITMVEETAILGRRFKPDMVWLSVVAALLTWVKRLRQLFPTKETCTIMLKWLAEAFHLKPNLFLLLPFLQPLVLVLK